jgi:dienelactone hydrolase
MIGALFFLMTIVASAQGKIRGEPVDYVAGDTTLKGYLAYDDGFSDKRPGILVVHEWWGHDEYARRRARMLAGLGYVALAVDMYGEGKQALHPDDDYATKFNLPLGYNADADKKSWAEMQTFFKDVFGK